MPHDAPENPMMSDAHSGLQWFSCYFSGENYISPSARWFSYVWTVMDARGPICVRNRHNVIFDLAFESSQVVGSRYNIVRRGQYLMINR